jgi:hypothetical protein
MILIVTDQTISRPIPAEVMNLSIDIWTISLIFDDTGSCTFAQFAEQFSIIEKVAAKNLGDILKTYCRCGTGNRTLYCKWLPNWITFFAWYPKGICFAAQRGRTTDHDN